MTEVLDDVVATVHIVPLSEAVEVNPKIDRRALHDDLDVSFIPMAAVEALSGGIDVSTVRKYADVKKGYTNFRDGDILFAKVTPCMENGKMAIAHHLVNGIGFGSTEFHVLRPRVGVDARYIYYFVSSQTFRKEASGHMTGAVGLRRVPSAYIEEQLMPLPGIERQREIVAELEKQFSRLDEAVANLQRVKANLKRYKASVLKDAVEGRLVPTEAELARRERRSFETGEQLLRRILETRRKEWKGRGKYKEPVSANRVDLAALPDGWGWATIEQLTYLVTSGSRGWGDFYSDTGVLFIRARDIKTDALNLKGLARVDVPVDAEGSRSSVGENDILVTITGANVTKTALVPMLSEPAFVSQHVALLKLTSSGTAAFVFAWVVSPANGRKTLEKWAYGAGKPGLSLEQVRVLPVALPPQSEQTRIVDEVERRLSLVRNVEVEVIANLKRALALRQATLLKAFSANH